MALVRPARFRAAKAFFFRSQPKPQFPCERPVDSTAGYDGAGDVAADMLFKGGTPGHEAESQPIVDHSEPAT
jgi:hypothetical protein